ncbi:hypothetical protein TgHK011_003546 [Trichoderma gracile]|nr:hypothetical protein TgHK011_003546 [Trichoderma gracile]
MAATSRKLQSGANSLLLRGGAQPSVGAATWRQFRWVSEGSESSERRLLRHKARLRGLSGPNALQVHAKASIGQGRQ